MGLPAELRTRYLDRLETLIGEGESLLTNSDFEPLQFDRQDQASRTRHTWTQADLGDATIWQHKVRNLLAKLIPKDHPCRPQVDDAVGFRADVYGIDALLRLLMATRDDFRDGFLDDLQSQIEATITVDYLEQAERLLTEGRTETHGHIPAAVLAGAILERHLRALCESRTPPLPVVNAKGERLTLNPLIDQLKSAGEFNELKAKLLRGWAGIRNAAAHGRFDEVNAADVETMLKGVTDFLAQHS